MGRWDKREQELLEQQAQDQQDETEEDSVRQDGIDMDGDGNISAGEGQNIRVEDEEHPHVHRKF